MCELDYKLAFIYEQHSAQDWYEWKLDVSVALDCGSHGTLQMVDALFV